MRQTERQARWRRRQTTGEEVPMFGMRRREFITLIGGAAIRDARAAAHDASGWLSSVPPTA
jgi:hypothetical protein